MSCQQSHFQLANHAQIKPEDKKSKKLNTISILAKQSLETKVSESDISDEEFQIDVDQVKDAAAQPNVENETFPQEVQSDTSSAFDKPIEDLQELNPEAAKAIKYAQDLPLKQNQKVSQNSKKIKKQKVVAQLLQTQAKLPEVTSQVGRFKCEFCPRTFEKS